MSTKSGFKLGAMAALALSNEMYLRKVCLPRKGFSEIYLAVSGVALES